MSAVRENPLMVSGTHRSGNRFVWLQNIDFPHIRVMMRLVFPPLLGYDGACWLYFDHFFVSMGHSVFISPHLGYDQACWLYLSN